MPGLSRFVSQDIPLRGRRNLGPAGSPDHLTRSVHEHRLFVGPKSGSPRPRQGMRTRPIGCPGASRRAGTVGRHRRPPLPPGRESRTVGPRRRPVRTGQSPQPIRSPAAVARSGPTDRGPGQPPVRPESQTLRPALRPGFGHATLERSPKEDAGALRCEIGADDERGAARRNRPAGMSDDDAVAEAVHARTRPRRP